MATARSLGSYVTFLELAKHEGREALLPLIQTLAEKMDFFGDAHVQVCNDGTGFEGVRQNTQPTGEWRAYNQGVGTGASTSTNFREPTGMLEGRFVADAALFDHMGREKGRAVRGRMIGEFMSGMLKTMADTILSGDRSVDGKRPYGITKRADYNATTSAYVHDNANGSASADSNKTYILLIGWGERKVSIIHPKDADLETFTDTANTREGEVTGLGIKMIPMTDDWEADVDGASKKFLAVRNHLKVHFGLCIEDAEYVQIGVNISTSNIDGIDDFALHENTMLSMLNAIPDTKNAFFYMNKTLRLQLRQRVNSMGNMYHTEKDAFGKWHTMVDEVPVHLMERIPDDGDTVN